MMLKNVKQEIKLADPFYRIIIATALLHDAKLMSDDGKFPKYIELKGRLL